MRFAAIADWADSGDYPVSFMCAWLGVSRSGYYAWRGAEPSQRSKDDSALVAVMRKIYEDARGNPGVRRMRAGLAGPGPLAAGGESWAADAGADARPRADRPGRWPRPRKWCGDIT